MSTTPELAVEAKVSRWCYECRHWPDARTGHPNRVERCKKGHGLTNGFANCDEWQQHEDIQIPGAVYRHKQDGDAYRVEVEGCLPIKEVRERVEWMVEVGQLDSSFSA